MLRAPDGDTTGENKGEHKGKKQTSEGKDTSTTRFQTLDGTPILDTFNPCDFLPLNEDGQPLFQDSDLLTDEEAQGILNVAGVDRDSSEPVDKGDDDDEGKEGVNPLDSEAEAQRKTKKRARTTPTKGKVGKETKEEKKRGTAPREAEYVEEPLVEGERFRMRIQDFQAFKNIIADVKPLVTDADWSITADGIGFQSMDSAHVSLYKSSPLLQSQLHRFLCIR